MAPKSFLRYVAEIYSGNGNHRMLNSTLVQRAHDLGYSGSRDSAMAQLWQAIDDKYLKTDLRFMTHATERLEKKFG